MTAAPVAAPPRAAARSLLTAELRQIDSRHRRVIVGIAIAGFLLRLFYWFYTNRVWEDGLITILHSENAGRGLGLTHYHPGMPPVHGFTSPLGVLVPLLADIFHPGWGLRLLKLVSAAAAVPTVLLAASIALNRAFQLHIWLVYLLCGYLAFEHHQVLWGMAGMETQLAVLALFLTMYQALRLSARGLGAAMALCMYARPDFAIFLAFVGLYLLVTDRAVLRKSIALSVLLYAPWLIFTTLYYGSPVPNTILAKGIGYPLWSVEVPLLSWAFFDNVWGRIYNYLFIPMGPFYAGHGTGVATFMDEGFISRVALATMAAGTIAMVRGFQKFYIIPLGSTIGSSLYYIFLVHHVFGWYLVPFSAVNCLLLVLALGALVNALVLPSRIALVCRCASLAYVLPFVAVLPLTFRGDHDIQRYVEPLRESIGRYLLANKRPGDRIGCEPLGYISYYSGMPVYDYPGLANAEVVRYLEGHPNGRTLEGVLNHFRPEWIALRESEYNAMTARPEMRFLKSDYAIEKVFRADPERARKLFRGSRNIDLAFYLLKKRS